MKRRTQTLTRSSLLAPKSVYTAYAVDCHTLPIWHVTYNADNKRAQSPSRRRGATAILRLARGLTSARARSGIPRHSGNCYRPVLFSNDTTVVEMVYDYMGRRFEYKETVNGILVRHERYLYRGYLQLAALDMLNCASIIRAITWDPIEPTATRPLVLQICANVYFYSFDQVKNVTELFDSTGTLVATYDYSPFGQVTSALNVGSSAFGVTSNPLTFSSEIHDSTLGLQYYNYRHLNTLDGRWVNRDLIEEDGGENLYEFSDNLVVVFYDVLGKYTYKDTKNVFGVAKSGGMIGGIIHGYCDRKDPGASVKKLKISVTDCGCSITEVEFQFGQTVYIPMPGDVLEDGNGKRRKMTGLEVGEMISHETTHEFANKNIAEALFVKAEDELIAKSWDRQGGWTESDCKKHAEKYIKKEVIAYFQNKASDAGIKWHGMVGYNGFDSNITMKTKIEYFQWLFGKIEDWKAIDF